MSAVTKPGLEGDTTVVALRVPSKMIALIDAVRYLRGDEYRSDTMREALEQFLKKYMKDGVK